MPFKLISEKIKLPYPTIFATQPSILESSRLEKYLRILASRLRFIVEER
jgi:hypothetical protein